jgi:arylsulfatase
MRARVRLVAAAVASLGLLGLTGCGGGEQGQQRPSVVLIVVDTLRADAILDPGGLCATPSIDALAADGVGFTRSFSHAPMTLPSHTALFSSRPPFETGVLNNWQPVREDLPLLAEWLQDYGYQTRAVIGLGTLDAHEASGLDRGFDDYDVEFWNMDEAPGVTSRLRTSIDQLDPERPFFLFAHFTDPHAPYHAHGTQSRKAELLVDGEVLETLELTDLNLFKRELELEPGTHTFEMRSADNMRIRAFQCIQKGRKLDLDWTAGGPHKPSTHARVEVRTEGPQPCTVRLWINDSLNRKDSQRRYIKEVEFVDGYIGELMSELKARGLYDDTLVIFTSDHGEALGERKMIGHVQNLHDEMIHVPLVIKPPAGHPATGSLRAVRQSLTPHADLVPTILEIVGLPGLPDQRGTSLLQEHERFLIAQTHKPESKRNFVCLRDERYKMILDPDEGTYAMFDLAEDPGELVDVFAELRSQRAAWVGQLETIARIVEEGGLLGDERDPETLERLKALGYL